MEEITLLGGVAVLVDGQPLSGESAQRRRLALLALLADAPLRPVSRDRLMLHLWPDNDTDSARHLLSAALHVLRKALGPDVIVTSGDHVGLNARRVRVDVGRFEEAARGEDPERALVLYGGPFLDGLFLPTSAEFEQWQSGRRSELAATHAAVLERAADARAAAGRLDDAVEAWRRLAGLDPYSARTVIGLMRALVAAGNRAGALQAARVHEQLLESEFGASPEPDVLRLAEELRLEPRPRPELARPAPARAQAAREAEAFHPEHAGAEAFHPEHAGAEASHPGAAAERPVAESRPTRPPIPGLAPWRRWRPALLAVALGAGLFVWIGKGPPSARVMVVVPRASPGADSAANYIAYGIAETIDYELGRAGSLRIVRTGWDLRDSALDARAIGRRLSADLLVTVTARMVGETPRVRVELLRSRGVEVLYLDQLMAEALNDASVRSRYIEELLHSSKQSGGRITQALYEYLDGMDTPSMVQKVMAGVRKSEVRLPQEGAKQLHEMLASPYPFYLDPMPNLYFTRDSAAVIGRGVTISRMRFAARRRESLFFE
jgi:DNA-binding SARP family transcriptional activator/TolB-like protein